MILPAREQTELTWLSNFSIFFSSGFPPTASKEAVTIRGQQESLKKKSQEKERVYMSQSKREKVGGEREIELRSVRKSTGD